MTKTIRLTALAAVVLILGVLAFAAVPGDGTAKDPVCGMSVKVQGAAHTAEFQGKTYYFCSDACKTAFLEDPTKYVGGPEAPAAAASSRPCCPRCPMMARMGKSMLPPPPAPPAPPAAPGAPQAPAMPECPMMMAMESMPCCAMMDWGRMPMRMAMRHHRPMMMGGDFGPGMPPGFGLVDKADLSVENTSEGVVVRITSKDPEAVKLIQKHWAMRKAAREAASAPAPKPDEKK